MIRSSVNIQSNLKILKAEAIYKDKLFLESIIDPKALERVKKEIIDKKVGYQYGYRTFTDMQERIYENCSIPCSYALTDFHFGDTIDYPFGIVRSGEKASQLSCVCENVECKLFSKCRSDINDYEKEKIKKTLEEIKQNNIIKQEERDKYEEKLKKYIEKANDYCDRYNLVNNCIVESEKNVLDLKKDNNTFGKNNISVKNNYVNTNNTCAEIQANNQDGDNEENNEEKTSKVKTITNDIEEVINLKTIRLLNWNDQTQHRVIKPESVIIYGEEYHTSDWDDMYLHIMTKVYMNNKKIFSLDLNKDKMKIHSWAEARTINNAEEILDSGYYIDGMLTSKEIVERLFVVKEICKISDDDLKIYCTYTYEGVEIAKFNQWLNKQILKEIKNLDFTSALYTMSKGLNSIKFINKSIFLIKDVDKIFEIITSIENGKISLYKQSRYKKAIELYYNYRQENFNNIINDNDSKLKNKDDNLKLEQNHNIKKLDISELELTSDNIVKKEYQEDINFAKNDNKEFNNNKSIDDNLEEYKVVSQGEYLALDNKRRVIVNAGPGTGKTWSLIQRIINILNNGSIKPDEILVLCYTRAARLVVEQRLQEAAKKFGWSISWKQINLRTLDSFAGYVANEMQDEYEWKCVTEQYDSTIKHVNAIFKSQPNLLDNIKYFIVDEIQDIVGIRAELLLTIIQILNSDCGFTLFGDICQAIYDYDCVYENQKTSDDLYSSIYKFNPAIIRLEFDKNFRISNNDFIYISKLREALLNNNVEEVKNIINDLKNSIPVITFDDLCNKFNSNEKMAILLRKNSQAISLSRILEKYEKDFVLDVNNEINLNVYPEWIGRFFCTYQYETIDEMTFINHYVEVYPDSDIAVIKEKWYVIVDLFNESLKNRFEVSDVLDKIWKKSYRMSMLEGENTSEKDVVVSTIHKSKGKEYDIVVIRKSVFDKVLHSNNIIEEARVLYVALTRTKSQIYSYITSKEEGLYRLDKYEKVHGRSYAIKDNIANSKTRGRRIHNIGKANIPSNLNAMEIIFSLDFEYRLFSNKKIQDAILSKSIAIGNKLELVKSNAENITYELVDLDLNINYGKINDVFVEDYVNLFKWNPVNKEEKCFSGKMERKYYPQRFYGVNITGIVTYISNEKPFDCDVKKIGNVYIWLGFEANGLLDIKHDDMF